MLSILFLNQLSGGQITGIVIGSVLGLFILVLGVYILWRNFHRSSLNRRVQSLDTMRISALNHLQSDVDAKLQRISIISERSDSFKQYLEEGQREKQDILNSTDASLRSNLDRLKAMLKKFPHCRGFARVYRDASTDALSLTERVNQLSSQLAGYLSQDKELNERIAHVKDQLRNYKEFVSDNTKDLVAVSSVLDFFFKGLDDQFEAFDILLEKADYEAAQQQVQQLEILVKALDSYGRKLPDIISMVSTSLPQSLVSLYRDYREKVNQGLPLDHLDVQNRIENMCKQVTRVRESLSSLDIGHDEEIIRRVKQELKDIRESFAAEEQAKVTLTAKKIDFSRATYDLSTSAMDIKEKFAKAQRTFVISETEQHDFASIDVELSDISSSKEIFDELLHATIPQPYTKLLKRYNDLSFAIEHLRDVIAGVNSYLDELTGEFATLQGKVVADIARCYQIQESIEATGVDPFIDKYMEEVNGVLSSFDEITAILHSSPCDVVRASNLFVSVDERLNQLKLNVKASLDSMQKAESNALVLNLNFESCRLQNAGYDEFVKAFWSGDFYRAEKLSTDLIHVVDDSMNNSAKFFGGAING
mgnify:FL=1